MIQLGCLDDNVVVIRNIFDWSIFYNRSAYGSCPAKAPNLVSIDL